MKLQTIHSGFAWSLVSSVRNCYYYFCASHLFVTSVTFSTIFYILHLLLHFSQLLEIEKDLSWWNLKYSISYKPLAKTYGFIHSLVALIWWKSSMHWTFSIYHWRADFLAKSCWEFKGLKWSLLCAFISTLNSYSCGTTPSNVSVRSVFSPLIFAADVRCCINASGSSISLFLSSTTSFLIESVDPPSLDLMDGIPYWLE